MNTNENASQEFCQNCHVGSLRSYRTTYAHWHDGQFVIMPGVPAWRCDFCGDTFYDDEIMIRLTLLLELESGLEDQRQWRATGLEEGWGSGFGDRRRV